MDIQPLNRASGHRGPTTQSRAERPAPRADNESFCNYVDNATLAAHVRALKPFSTGLHIANSPRVTKVPPLPETVTRLTVEGCDIATLDLSTSGRGVKHVEVRNCENLKAMAVGAIKSLILQNCPALGTLEITPAVWRTLESRSVQYCPKLTFSSACEFADFSAKKRAAVRAAATVAS